MISLGTTQGKDMRAWESDLLIHRRKGSVVIGPAASSKASSQARDHSSERPLKTHGCHLPLLVLSTNTCSADWGAEDKSRDGVRHSILGSMWIKMEETIDRPTTHVWVIGPGCCCC